MASKHPSTSSQESDSKKSRMIITIEKNFDVLYRYAKGEKTLVIVHVTELRESTLGTIRANIYNENVFSRKKCPVSAAEPQKGSMATPVPQKDDVENWTVEEMAAWLQQKELSSQPAAGNVSPSITLGVNIPIATKSKLPLVMWKGSVSIL
ncbi:hypothetical protein E2C01_020195 [Portunus trituberculatus]|uniref:Uncharacterized protein n=1 Tax=Portunus trituberculatus TaxID=210409 RepID=A0A5B7DZ59_PORTR|nr:hypothetical protein [Portunus trituberculatus]